MKFSSLTIVDLISDVDTQTSLFSSDVRLAHRQALDKKI